MIRPTTAFTLDTATADTTAKSVLLLGGKRVGRVNGRRIDAQFEAGRDGFVVLVSYGDMFSAMESCCFVDRAGTIRDTVTLGHATEQGLITEIAVDGDAITFAFPMNERHRLRVAREPRWFGLRERWLHLDG